MASSSEPNPQKGSLEESIKIAKTEIENRIKVIARVQDDAIIWSPTNPVFSYQQPPLLSYDGYNPIEFGEEDDGPRVAAAINGLFGNPGPNLEHPMLGGLNRWSGLEGIILSMHIPPPPAQPAQEEAVDDDEDPPSPPSSGQSSGYSSKTGSGSSGNGSPESSKSTTSSSSNDDNNDNNYGNRSKRGFGSGRLPRKPFC